MSVFPILSQLGNSGDGVSIADAPDNTVGGTTDGARNIISGNAVAGVSISGDESTGNLVEGNFIGTDINGTATLGNSRFGVIVQLGASGNTVGGATLAARNIVADNRDYGVEVSNGARDNLVLGNFIGSDVTGTDPLGNGTGVCVQDATSNTIGGTAAGAGNLISGNVVDGVLIDHGSTRTLVLGNYIGTDVNGTDKLGNGRHGVRIEGAFSNTIGGASVEARNVIAHNDGSGVLVSPPAATENAILSNSIFSNAGLGIDLDPNGVTPNDPGDDDTGANNLQNFPVVTSATSGSSTIEGTLNSTASATFRLEFFSNSECDPSGHGEGETFLGSTMVTTDGSGDVGFAVTLDATVPLGHFITATATDPDNNTSEFSLCIQVNAPAEPHLVTAFTGEHWNSDTMRIEGDRRIAPNVFLPGASDHTMIRVEFSEDLDGASISHTDFLVDGVVPHAAMWFDAVDSNTGLSVRNSVFLEVDPLAADAIPTVEIVGEVADLAGNIITMGQVVTQDSIAPSATVTLSTQLSTGMLDITVATDESIRTASPPLQLFVTDVDSNVVDSTQESPTRVSSVNEWIFNLNIATAQRYSVVVTVEDAAGNQGSVGVRDLADPNAITFEIDNGLPLPDTFPLDGAEIREVDPFFVEMDWFAEGAEYPGDSHDGVTLTKVVLDEGTDAERDVLHQASTRNARTWFVAILNIGLGRHTVTFNGEDDLVNTLADDVTLTFEVVRATFVLSLVPGMNLVSLPGNPVSTDINAVIGVEEPVNRVMTYDLMMYDAHVSARVERADVDGNGCVEQGDLVAIAQDFSTRPTNGDESSDVNGDGIVDVNDLALAGLDFWRGPAPQGGPVTLPNTPNQACDLHHTGWLRAARDPETGLFAGDLRNIDARHGYWIEAGATLDLKVEIRPLGAQQLLPTIQVLQGWNLVPVMNLQSLDRIHFGTELDADDYLGSNWSRAFTFVRGRWVSIATGVEPDGDLETVGDAVQIGRAYWVYFTEDDTLRP